MIDHSARTEQYIALITTLANSLGQNSHPTLAATVNHLLNAFNRGVTAPTSQPVVTAGLPPVRKEKASYKVAVSESLLGQLNDLNNSGRFVKTARRHGIGINSVRSAMSEKRATPDMIQKLQDMVDDPVGVVKADYFPTVVCISEEIHDLGSLAS